MNQFVHSVETAREILGVEAGASHAAIVAAYREAAKRTHPDTPGGSTTAFLRVREALDFLDNSDEFAPTDAPPPPRREAGHGAPITRHREARYVGGRTEVSIPQEFLDYSDVSIDIGRRGVISLSRGTILPRDVALSGETIRVVHGYWGVISPGTVTHKRREALG